MCDLSQQEEPKPIRRFSILTIVAIALAGVLTGLNELAYLTKLGW